MNMVDKIADNLESDHPRRYVWIWAVVAFAVVFIIFQFGRSTQHAVDASSVTAPQTTETTVDPAIAVVTAYALNVCGVSGSAHVSDSWSGAPGATWYEVTFENHDYLPADVLWTGSSVDSSKLHCSQGTHS